MHYQHHAQQSDRLTLLFKLFVNAGVVATERAYANHGNGDNGV